MCYMHTRAHAFPHSNGQWPAQPHTRARTNPRTDSGSLAGGTEITVHIEDENDNTPVFKPRTYSTQVLENATIGQNILPTTAFDKDDGLNGVIRYTIVSGDKTSDFTIPQLYFVSIEMSA